VGAVAVSVGDILRRKGIRAVLTGGACAALHSNDAYSSLDVDFVLGGRTSQDALDDAMATAGYRRDGDRYVHSRHPYVVEFPRGPLGIGDDVGIRPVIVRRGRASTLALSLTDSCRDRLAAFYHWNDRQGLRAAVVIAARRRVDFGAIRRWSVREGFTAKFGEFERAVRASRGSPARRK
jgi:hypothetical protein